MLSRGRVSLVGAGPGDPELITLRGLRRLREADVVVYDRLVHPSLVAKAPPGAERVFAGKARGHAALSQQAIEALLIDRASAGYRVVRLKGGDPFVFGRGGEELLALVAAGIPAEIVPGVTSATAVPASAGIPVTHRHLSSSITIVTGHEDPRKFQESVDWRWLASSTGTLVILMGLGRIRAICDRLIEEGMGADTPAAVVSAGTLPEQRAIRARLGDLAAAAQDSEVEPPTLIVVGEVVRFPDLLPAVQPFTSGALALQSPDGLRMLEWIA